MTATEEFKATLRERAGRLSRPLTEPPKDLKRVVIFKVGRELFGLGIEHVIEILRPDSITYVPGAEPHIEGVTNLRGEIVTVTDLESLLTGNPRSGVKSQGDMIVGEFQGNKLGMIVTSVDGIYDIQAGLIDPPLTTLEKIKAEHLVGEFMFEERIVGLLSPSGLMEIKVT